jgi:hypothetical protein
MEEQVDAAPSECRGEVLPRDHPAAKLSLEKGDCIAHIPAAVKDPVAAAHGNRVPPDIPVDPGELV